ncbi:hypothetical protein LP7551_02063 [Roseibium album]|nr:hypothetical protein LP7551_02063 [Roseibium album]
MAARTPQVGVRLAVLDGKVVERELKKFGREGETALNRIQKASRPASRGLKTVDRAASEVRKSASALSGRLGPLGSVMSSIGPAGAAAAIGLGALALGLTKAMRIGREAVREFDALAKQARTTGLSTDLYQALKLAADEQGVAQKKLNTSLSKFVVEAGKASTATGTLYLEMKRMTPAFLEQFQAAETGDQRLRVLAKAVQSLDNAQQKAALTAAAFGQRNVDMGRILGNTEESFDGLIQRATELGVVVDKSVLKRAEEMENKLGVAARVIDINLKQAFVDLTPIIVTVVQTIASLARGINSLVDSIRDFEDKSATGRASALEQLRDDLAIQDRKIATERGKANVPGVAAFAIENELRQLEEERERIRADLSALERAEFKIQDRASRRGQGAGGTGSDTSLLSAAEAIRKRIQTADEKRIQTLGQINRLEKEGLLSADEASRARLQAEESYSSVVKKTGRTGRQAEAKLLREVQSLLKASTTPAEALEKRLKRIAELQSGGVFDRASGSNGEAVANSARVTAMREYLSAAKDTSAALERLQELAQGGLGADALAAQVALAERAGESFGKTMTDVSSRISDGLTDAIFDANDQAKDFGETMKGLARQLARDFLNSQLRGLFGQMGGSFGGSGNLISGLLSSLFGGVGGGASNAVRTATAGIYHDGGKIGPGGHTRQVPASLFANAERRHQGGFIGPGERAIIAEDDERMLTLAMQKNTADSLRGLASMAGRSMSGGGQSSSAPTVKIYPQPGQAVETQERQGPSGGIELDIILGPIERALATKVAEGGKLSKSIGKHFGLNRANGLAG